MKEEGSDHITGNVKTEEKVKLKLNTVSKSNNSKGTSLNSDEDQQKQDYKLEIVWLNTIAMIILHMMSIYGFYLTFAKAKLWTTAWAVFVGYLGGLGVSAGSHRLWSHRSFKATLPMKIALMLMHSIANEDCIYYWVRDHRVHHKYTDTNADPYNAGRGFFFSHMGWLLVKKHPDVKKFGKGIDLSDITSDPVVAFQKKYFLIIMPIMNIILPTWVPMYFWNETFEAAFFIAIWKWVGSLHVIWSVNSVAHSFGYKPFDRLATATDNPYFVLSTLGEAWHNYHHAFPFDYRVADVPFYFFHPTGTLLEFLSLFGLVYDLKTAPLDLAMRQADRHGDGTVKKARSKADINNDELMRMPLGSPPIRNYDDANLNSGY